MNALILGIFWIIYYAMHIALGRGWVKRFFSLQSPAVYHSYRLLYVFFSFVNFVLLLWFHMITPSKYILYPPFILQVAGFVLGGASFVVFGLSLASYRFRFWVDLSVNAETKPLITTGINRIVRHPLYFGVVLFLIALLMIIPNWKNFVFAVVTIIYLIIGALHEERKLLDIYGNDFTTYRKEVKMLIPFII